MSSAEGLEAVGRAPAWRAWLELARISNAPTVVSNVVAGAALAAGAGARTGDVAIVALAVVAFYTAGMFLNDILDLEVDRRERPERPLPSGRIAQHAAVAATAALFAAGEVLVLAVDTRAGAAGLGLIAAIVAYDAWHKGNPLSPALMGLCRGLVYVVAALAVAGAVSGTVAVAGALLALYVVGLTQVAKAEGTGIAARWPVAAVLAPAAYWAKDADQLAVALLLVAFAGWACWALRLVLARRAIGTGVVRLIAGVALYDAVVAAASGAPAGAVVVCLAAFALTVALQTRIAGT
jgi:4-hydroxybenzoate polyprenyltransferase